MGALSDLRPYPGGAETFRWHLFAGRGIGTKKPSPQLTHMVQMLPRDSYEP